MRNVRRQTKPDATKPKRKTRRGGGSSSRSQHVRRAQQRTGGVFQAVDVPLHQLCDIIARKPHVTYEDLPQHVREVFDREVRHADIEELDNIVHVYHDKGFCDKAGIAPHILTDRLEKLRRKGELLVHE